jgi:hypothetical protein
VALLFLGFQDGVHDRIFTSIRWADPDRQKQGGLLFDDTVKVLFKMAELDFQPVPSFLFSLCTNRNRKRENK